MADDETLWPTESELQTLTMLGTKIADRYEIHRLLGQGGMGSVYVATDQLLDREVAIKIMTAEPVAGQNTARFFREARSLARLNHPNIVTIYDYGWHGQQAYLVMEYVTGVTLRAMLDGQGIDTKGLAIDKALDIAGCVTKALSYAHSHGVIHRDIKPQNIMIGDEIKLMDFGIAKIRQDPSITMAAATVGTPLYMAPEQALGNEIDERTDLYSLGVLLYEMLTGRPPFLATDEMPVLSQHLQVMPVAPCLRNPIIPSSLERLILTMLAKAPDKRPASADEVLLNLETCRQNVPTITAGEVPMQKTVRADEAKIETLMSIPLFASISSDDLSELSRQLMERRYRKGETIFHKDDFGSTLHTIKLGNVKISIPSEKGEDVVLAYLGPGDFFGELALLDENPRSATATAVEYTETLALERANFLDFLRWYPDAAIRILAVLAQRLRNLNSQLENIIFSDPPSRLARALLRLMETSGSETQEGWQISLRLSAAELAGMIGVTTRTMRRLLHDFQKAGVLSTKDRHYVIHKPEELRRRVLRGASR